MQSFPFIEGERTTYPSTATCPQCNEQRVFEPHSMAILCGGAILMDRAARSGGPSDDLDGFLDLSWHGAHDGGAGIDPDIYVNVSLASEVRGGQFELYFCSTMCLRQFLNTAVDELERRVQAERG